MKFNESYFEANRQSWNKRTEIHKDSSFYDLESFKGGKTSLNAIELDELGEIDGKKLLHLQCHFGMDTMSWERKGATCVGVDLSDEAIKLANEIRDELSLESEFICANIYDLKDTSKVIPTERFGEGLFDIVFTSYGTIGWLPDLDLWAATVSHFLKPSGTFYMVDFHPVLWMMDSKFEKITYDYFNTDVITEEVSGTYTDRDAPIHSVEHGWNHPFSEILNALISHHIQIDFLHEFPFSPYNCFSNLQQSADGMWRIKGIDEKMPMLYSIKATKR